MTTTQDAPARIDCGMPLSGVAMISPRTSEALCRRSLSFAISAACALNVTAESAKPHRTAENFFIWIAFPLLTWGQRESFTAIYRQMEPGSPALHPTGNHPVNF